MKILLYTMEYPPFKGGVANYYENLVRHWPAAEDIFVLHKKCRGRLTQYFCYFFSLVKAVKKNKIDHILVGQILPLGSLVHLFWRFTKIKYTVFLHGLDLSSALKHRRKAWVAKHILSDAAGIICANSYTAELLKKKFPQFDDKISVVNPGVAEFKERRPISLPAKLKNKTLLLSIGRLVKRKGFDSVLKVLPADLAYVIIGVGPEGEALKAAASENVYFTGALTEAEKWSWLEACDIFIMPARDLDGDFEGFGIVYLEANLCAKPVIAGSAGGVKDAVEDGINGLVVDPENLAEIREAIIKLAGDKELRDKLGRAGQVRARQEFNWSALAFKVLKSLKN